MNKENTIIANLKKMLDISTETLVEYECREFDSGNLRGGIAANALRQIIDIEQSMEDKL